MKVIDRLNYKMTRYLIFLFFVGVACFTGCADRPELMPAQYGQIVNELPNIPEANEPFPFPRLDEVDHTKCKFDEMGELIDADE
ncbi:hypothetical protein FACS189443_4130 [Planctomycetales bacterium]|nr:hypothetical protein FACS189443_4130 [Planctomycetales bacterium]